MSLRVNAFTGAARAPHDPRQSREVDSDFDEQRGQLELSEHDLSTLNIGTPRCSLMRSVSFVSFPVCIFKLS